MNALPPHLQHLQHLQGEELKTAVQQEYFAQAVAFIVRQTDYDETTAVERLNELKDPVKVVKAYLGAVQDKDDDAPLFKSKNQMKYGEIRKFMDAGARQYNMKKELNAKYQEHLEKQQQQQQQQQQPHQQQGQQQGQEQEQSKGS